ncbi:4'-phosphopantetheinyl transferase family protein [Kushneria phyllosphaerae]|uniref:Enterobactin synthase component D n=1 Tax=Kushneria phyllosphaerae TaxID=2100822 RepID=A0A2R8CL98_9GAMM|nr:4'-phosphopantetheinyl transferase superfamily protein [Kushneria phyllosphaerae]SPJ33602.1 Enterobactin synthase component D [Kushneria phyllosphaerae]
MSNAIAPPKSCWPFVSPDRGARLSLATFDVQRFDDSAFAACSMALPESLARAVPKRRAEYLAGRVCARHALARLDIHVNALPSLADRQVDWPELARGSITHARDLAAALVSTAPSHQGVGVDAERWLTPERADYLAASILTPCEQQVIGTLLPEQRARAITLTFSLKESLFKALYPLTGTRFYFHDARVEALDPMVSPGQCRLVLNCALSDTWLPGVRLIGDFADMGNHALTAVMTDAIPDSTAPRR